MNPQHRILKFPINAGIPEIDQGISYVPGDRIRVGVAGNQSVWENIIMKVYRLPKFKKGLLLDNAKLKIARKKGITTINPREGVDPVKFVENFTNGTGADGGAVPRAAPGRLPDPARRRAAAGGLRGRRAHRPHAQPRQVVLGRGAGRVIGPSQLNSLLI